MRIHNPKLRNMTHALSLSIFIAFKGSNFSVFLCYTAAGVVQCGDPKKSPRTSSIVLIIFYFLVV